MAYNTKHSKEITDYLQTIPGRHVTAAELTEQLHAKGSGIGTATVYRQLEKLVDAGMVNKYIVDENSCACYEYVPNRLHCKNTVCYHMKCSSCGKLYHMHCPEIRVLIDHMSNDHGFTVDPKRTVFYGICGECNSK